jgi:uncharacterized protein YecE (DUF72 family)
MIYIGLTGWGDHYSIYTGNVKPKNKLIEYSSHFPLVEVDTAFYAVQPEKNVKKWVSDTPDNFRFIVKAYQGMTGHQRREDQPFDSVKEMFTAYKKSLEPYIHAGKLACVLFQFPPWFTLKKENVNYLRYCRKMMGDIPVALEFRHQSWFSENYRESTLQFMIEEGWIHSIVDEPQAGSGTIPTVPIVTHPKKTMIRMHGRNVHGWNKPNSADTNWREVRYLYDYNQNELMEWKNRMIELEKETKELYIVFNNNSGGHAAGNAKELQKMLGITYEGLSPKQLGFF